MLKNKLVWQIAGEGGAGSPPPAIDPAAAPPPAAAGSLLSAAEVVPSAPAEVEGAAPVAPAEVAPITIADLKLPEGVTAEDATLASALEIFNEKDLTPAGRLQKLVDLQHTVLTQAQASAEALWEGTQSQWQKDVQALPEIGGSKLPETLAAIKRGLDQVGATKATYEAFDVTGAGNHPEIVKVLHALTKHLSEGKPVSGTPTKGPLSLADKMFGNTQKE